MSDLFLDALRSKNRGRPPIWIMRQAGRYLPSYQALRKKHSLYDLFFTPELALQATLLPVQEMGVDAAILFSDITVIVKALGLSLDFKEGVGPVIDGAVNEGTFDLESLQPIATTIRLLRKELTVPLIGFCGGPFTVASYCSPIKKLLYLDPEGLHSLLRTLTEATKAYLDLQIENGAQAIQIFDSWADLLTLPDLSTFCLPYHKQLVDHVKQKGIPVISFMRLACLHAAEIARMAPDAISFDWQQPLALMRQKIGPSIAIQGNLDPDLLYAPLPVIEARAKELLLSMEGDPGFVVNLGHGVKPDVPWQAVRCLVDTVRQSQSLLC